MTETAFYCVADARYFPGLVAMVNSLRLQGHDEPIYVLDCGLTQSQRARLGVEAKIVERPDDAAPWMQKTYAPLKHPARVMVLIDADMIATRPLTEPIRLAGADRIVAFRNDHQLHFSEWGDLLDLGPTRPGPYVSSGLVAIAGAPGLELLRLWDDRKSWIDPSRSYFGANEPGYEFPYLDQDVFNAILRTRVEPERLVALEHRLAANPPFDGLKIADARRLRCRYSDTTEPFVLHHFDRKPWQARLRSNVYSRLLTRLLLADDVAIRLDAAQLPRRLRKGPTAGAERGVTDLIMIGPGIARRARERRRHGDGAQSERHLSRRLRVVVATVGWTGHAYPAFALARELGARGHEVTVHTFERWRATVAELGAEFVAAREQMSFGEIGQGGGTPTLAEGAQELAPLLNELRPDVVVHDLFTLAPALAAERAGLKRATLIPHPYPAAAPGLPPYTLGTLAPRTWLGGQIWRGLAPAIGANLPNTKLRATRATLNDTRSRDRTNAARRL